jgi:plastocyanin
MRKQLLVPVSVAALALAPAALPSAAADTEGEASATKRVRVGDNFFRKSSIAIQRGDSVRWVWVGSLEHNVTVTRGPRRFSSATKSSGVYRKRLRARGTYRYVCTVHPSNMRGRVVVR